MAQYIGIDIGGTKILVASTDKNGAIINREKQRTPLDLQEGLDTINRMIETVSQGEPITAIGAGIGGPMDWETGIVSPLHQPQWREIPLKSIMEQRWKCPFYVDNDANVAALGEYHFGHGKVSRLLFVTFSTGVGGGFCIDGTIFRGKDNAHPEIAHQSINYRCLVPEKIHCECGVADCLEAMVSGNGIRRIYGKPPENLNEREWDEVTYNMSQGLRNLAAIYCPDIMVLGGGIVVGRGEKLIVSIRQFLEKNVTIVPLPQVRISRLGTDTTLMGAIALAISSP